VIRGGSWRGIALYCRAADRNGSLPSNGYDGFGFRSALLAGQ
jgi:formylglycine-generating enzyme required for sulfatase activity